MYRYYFMTLFGYLKSVTENYDRAAVSSSDPRQ